MEDIAYSYIRFSSMPQDQGDSVRRQTAGAEGWSKKSKVVLDRTLIIDRGMSGFRGKNADIGNLAAFLKRIENGDVRPGSYLIVESLDRLTRNDVQPALRLILGILQSGVRIVQLQPVEVIYDDKSDVTALVLMIVELSRANSESRVKSIRGLEVRKRRRIEAREGKPILQRHPQWVRWEGGRYTLIPERADVIRRVFRLAGEGYGAHTIVRKLIDAKIPSFSPGKPWNRTYVLRMLKNRQALGEFQPCGPGRKPEGEPIPDYFPSVVSVDEYNRALSKIRERRQFRGSVGLKTTNVFAGILHNARVAGDNYILSSAKSESPGPSGTRTYPVLVNNSGMEGRTRYMSIRYEVFETCVLGELRELDPTDLLDDDQGDGELHALTAELEQLDKDRELLLAELERTVSPTLMKAAEQKDTRRAVVLTRLSQLRAEAASPLSVAWAEGKTVLALMIAAEDKEAFRLRLRSALRRIVSGMHLLVVGVGNRRLCAVQVRFHGSDRRRNYLVSYIFGNTPSEPRRRGTKAQCRSLSDAIPEAADLNLTDPEDVLILERLLQALPA